MSADQYAAAAETAGRDWWLGMIALGVVALCVVVVLLAVMGVLEVRRIRQARDPLGDHFESTPRELAQPRHLPSQRRESEWS